MIPKIIHYVWLGEKPIPEEHQKYINGWKKLMPDYEFMFWTDKNFDFSKSIYATQSYQMKKWGFVPDYIRAYVLCKYGGIYLDTDVEVLKRFDDILDRDFFTSFENDAYIETAVLGSVPNHPFMQTIVDFYERHPFLKKDGSPDLTPSPLMWTYFLHTDYNMKLNAQKQTLSSLNDENASVTIFTNDYFAPINYTTKKLVTTDNTYAIHHFANSWAGASQNFTHKLTVFAYHLFGKRIFAYFTRRVTKHYLKKMKKLDKLNNFSQTKKIKEKC